MKHLLTQKLPIEVGCTTFNPNDGTCIDPTAVEISGPLKPDINSIGDVVNIGLGFLYPLAAILVFLYLVWGGLDFMTARGDAEKIKSAKAKITAAVVGFILLMVSFLIVRLFTFIFGLESEII